MTSISKWKHTTNEELRNNKQLVQRVEYYFDMVPELMEEKRKRIMEELSEGGNKDEEYDTA